jgi:hypothetical protein
MNSSKFAEIVEIFGSIAVVLTLIFVGVQLNSGNRVARAATIQASLQSEMDIMHAMADHAGAWDKVLKGETLDNGEEMRKGIILYNLLMTESENRYYQNLSGYLEKQSWEGRLRSLYPLVRLPIFELWQKTPGGINHSADFLALLNSVKLDSSSN